MIKKKKCYKKGDLTQIFLSNRNFSLYFRKGKHRHLFHSKNICPLSSSLLQGKYLPFSPSPFRLNMFRLFVILSLTQLYHYTPEIFLFSTAIFKYTYRAPQTNWTRIFSERRLVYFYIIETDTATSGFR